MRINIKYLISNAIISYLMKTIIICWGAGQKFRPHAAKDRRLASFHIAAG